MASSIQMSAASAASAMAAAAASNNLLTLQQQAAPPGPPGPPPPLPPPPSNQPINGPASMTSVKSSPIRRPRGDAKKCRKVYGMDHRDLWCTQCKWKKACTRFGEAVWGCPWRLKRGLEFSVAEKRLSSKILSYTLLTNLYFPIFFLLRKRKKRSPKSWISLFSAYFLEMKTTNRRNLGPRFLQRTTDFEPLLLSFRLKNMTKKMISLKR